jgi:S1-C subfamily serine protease
LFRTGATIIAVLRINAGGVRLPTIEFGDSERLKVGDGVIAIGNPFGLGQTVTSGIVSAVARTSFGVGDFRFFIQTDADAEP